nr:hypothetical protein [Lachnospiraceae bacterium]
MNLWDNVLNATDEAFVSEMLEEERAAEERRADAAEERRTNKNTGRRLKKWLIPAAACLILGVLIWGVSGGLFRRTPVNTWEQWNAYLHPAKEPEAMLAEEYRARIAEGPYASWLPVAVCAENRVGEKIGDTVVKAAWTYVGLDGTVLREPEEEKIETLRAEVYSLRNISPETAVCLKYLDRGDALTLTHYYTFLDPAAAFAGPAEFFGALDAAETMSLFYSENVTAAAVETAGEKDVSYTSYFVGADLANTLRERILALTGEAAQADEQTLYGTCGKRALCSLKFSFGFSGRLQILESGYLLFFPDNMHGAGSQSFRIDPAAAASLIRLLEDRAVPYVPDPVSTVTATTGTDIVNPE